MRFRIIALVLFTLIPAFALIFYHAFQDRRLAIQGVEAETLHLTKIASSTHAKTVEGARQLLIALSAIPEVRGEPEKCHTFLANIHKKYPSYAAFAVADINGDLRCSSLAMKDKVNVADRSYFQRVIRTRDFAFGDYIIGRVSGKPGLASGYPLWRGDEIEGVIVASLDLAWVNQLASEIQLPPGAVFSLIDNKGVVLARYPDSEKLIGKSFPDAPILNALLSKGEGTSIVQGLDGVERIYASTIVYKSPEASVFLNVGFVKENALSAVNRQFATHLILLAIAAIFALGIAWFGNNLFIINKIEADKTMLESIGDGLIAIDRFWNITLWNKAATALTGWSEEEVLGKPLRDIVKFISTGNRKENIAFIEETMLYGKPNPMEDGTILIKKDGSEIYVADMAAPVLKNGKTVGVIIIFRDISKDKELEKMREEFASLATHQLRTPVTAIKGYSEMLLDGSAGPLTAEQKKELLEIQAANGRLLELVNAMLNVSRIELGKLAIEPEPTYLPDIADGAIKELLPRIKNKKIVLKNDYAKNIPSVNADPKLMRVIFQNLLSNAVNYTPEKGTISLEIKKQQTDILVKVSDTGIGVPKEQQSMIFAKLFRADNAREKISEGTGLGLYIVKSILEQGGGKIWFESEENKGSAFFIAIPLAGMKRKEGVRGLT